MSESETTFAKWKREAQERELAIAEAHASSEGELVRRGSRARPIPTPIVRRDLCLCGECRQGRGE
jgi:hypothetical protein